MGPLSKNANFLARRSILERPHWLTALTGSMRRLYHALIAPLIGSTK